MEKIKERVAAVPRQAAAFFRRTLELLNPFSENRHFSFMWAHWIWIVTAAVLGSIIIYTSGRGNLAYIDAVVFATGASTQAGLNTVDVNKLTTFQQVVIFLWALACNPISINSFVVVLRLYWFERRFQHIVRDARSRRISVSKSKAKQRKTPGNAEIGVGGREITVMLNGNPGRIANDGTLLDPSVPKDKRRVGLGLRTANSFGPEGGDAAGESVDALRRPEIRFAPTVTKSDGSTEPATKLPPSPQLPPSSRGEDHIAIVERQKNGDDEVLRIPNPREAELGIRPERVSGGSLDDADEEPLSPTSGPIQPNFGRSPQAITIAEPDRRKFQESDSDDLTDSTPSTPTFSLFGMDIKKPQFLRRWAKHHGKDGNTSIKRRQSFQVIRGAFSREKAAGTPYLSWEPTIGRNSTFHDLTEEKREELGGIEYRSLKTLAVILFFYFWGFFALGIVILLPWILNVSPWGQVVDDASVTKTWWGFFTPTSAFMDLGFTLTPDSMNSFNMAVLPLLLMSFLIIIGNPGFPIMLRFIIWLLSLVVPGGSGLYQELKFLLDHPRRCFTLLFPSGATWVLFGILVLLNGVDVFFFIVLDLGSGPVVDLPAGIKVLNGFFEAASTRTAGFSCVNLALLHPAVQVSYMIMMYISVFPIAISVRRTNVYEEQSVGVYGNPEDEEGGGNQSDMSYIGFHLRRQLSFDLWYIFLGFFALSITEGNKLMAGEFTMFAVLFELVSAYGTVGMSLGWAGGNESLCSQFTVLGKLIICAMMLRGRHRGLPYHLDRAILLPSEALNAREAADADARISRLPSHVSANTDGQNTSVRRRRSFAGDLGSSGGGILASLLHPGPAMNHTPQPHFLPLHRRSTDPTHDGDTRATRVSSRQTEPGATLRMPTFKISSPGTPETAGANRS